MIGGGQLLRLIGRYLGAGVELPDGTRDVTPLGVPQGGPLSPLLANLVIDALDMELARRGHVFARYQLESELGGMVHTKNNAANKAAGSGLHDALLLAFGMVSE